MFAEESVSVNTLKDEESKQDILQSSTKNIFVLSKRRFNYEAFTVSIPSEDHVKEADYLGIASGRDENKFECACLTPVRSEVVPAPYIEEFPVIIECKLLHSLEVGLHTIFVGEIMDIKAEESVLDENGNPDIEKIRPIVYGTGNKSYYSIGCNLGKAFSIGKNL